MSNQENDDSLLTLIRSLTKSEKRYLKLFTQRSGLKKEALGFITLFDVIDKTPSIEYTIIRKQMPDISKKKFSDLKRNLYSQILMALRVYNSKKDDHLVSTKIENARILYKKGLIKNSLIELEKAKAIALRRNNYMKALEVVHSVKKIELRHITRSHFERAAELEKEGKLYKEIVRSESDWLDFSLKIYAYYIKNGHVRNDDQLNEINVLFNSQKPKENKKRTNSFFEQLNQIQSYTWYYFVIQNFIAGYKNNRKWIELFDEYPKFKQRYPHTYIRGYHNCLSVLYNCLDYRRHTYYLNAAEDYISKNTFDDNTNQKIFIYINTAKLNEIVLTGTFSQSKKYLEELEMKLNQRNWHLDEYRNMVFWYKMASIYFTMGDHDNCQRLLNFIINPNQKSLREDIQCFARLLNIINHYEQQNFELLSHLIVSTYRFLFKMKHITQIHKTIIQFLKSSLYMEQKELKSAFFELHKKLTDLSRDPYEKRSFLYLDFLSWLESKIKNIPVEAIIHSKRLDQKVV